jgi:transcription initiation factor IIE alpha subunit
MINQEQTLACPVCSSKIHFDAKELLKGVKFKCPNIACDASIGMATESKPIVTKAMDKFEEIKANLGQ